MCEWAVVGVLGCVGCCLGVGAWVCAGVGECRPALLGGAWVLGTWYMPAPGPISPLPRPGPFHSHSIVSLPALQFSTPPTHLPPPYLSTTTTTTTRHPRFACPSLLDAALPDAPAVSPLLPGRALRLFRSHRPGFVFFLLRCAALLVGFPSAIAARCSLASSCSRHQPRLPPITHPSTLELLHPPGSPTPPPTAWRRSLSLTPFSE